MTKYNRTFHFPFSPGATSDDRVGSSVFDLLKKEIVITEKLDGENCGMNNEGVYARSHSDFTKSPWSREVRNIHSRFIKGYLDEGMFIFGENMEGIHSIEYSKLTSYFYLFAVRLNKTWLSWGEVEEFAYLLDVPTVPVLFRGSVDSEKELANLVKKLASEPSVLGGPKEGVVVRVFESFQNDDFSKKVMKYVRENHITTDEHWTKNWQRAKINEV